MKRFILFDIDHTLSDAAHRDHLIEAAMQSGDWEAYHGGSIADERLEDTVTLLNALCRNGYHVIGVTARPEQWRELTASWLRSKSISLYWLLMRPNEDHSNSPELKLELVRRFLGDKFADEILFIVDDRADVCEAFANAGVSSLQIRGKK